MKRLRVGATQSQCTSTRSSIRSGIESASCSRFHPDFSTVCQAKNVFFRVFASAISKIFVFADDFKTAFLQHSYRPEVVRSNFQRTTVDQRTRIMRSHPFTLS